MTRSTMDLTRRRFLAGVGGGLAAIILTACGIERSSQSSSSPAVAPTPTETPTPQPTTTPGPSLRDRIGQMLLVGFRGLTIEDAGDIVADIRDRNLGGILLFDTDQPTHSAIRNVESPAQLTALVSALQAVATTPLFVAIDEEGGLVARLDQRHGFPATISAADLGARGDTAFTRQAGEQIAGTLASVGVNLNLAPVVDLNVNPTNPIIGALGRSFSADPTVVTAQAEAFIEGHHAKGAHTTLKHFPGHGSSTGDTHLGVVDVTDTWSRKELEPFANVVHDGLADAVLTAHVFNSTLDPEHPATLSQPTITGILRGEIGWDGVVISDDMQMGAIRDAYGYPDAIRLAILAGVDVLTIAQQQVFQPGIVAQTIDLIEGFVTDGSLTEARIDESYARIRALKGLA
ncbi:MAG: glycoside hydrolase family 3 protein [Candidatus Limnocylindria bacterium]